MEGQKRKTVEISFWTTPFMWMGFFRFSKERTWENLIDPGDTGLVGKELAEEVYRRIPLDQPEKDEYYQSMKQNLLARNFAGHLIQFLFYFLIPLIIASCSAALLAIDFDFAEISEIAGTALLFVMMFYASCFLGLIVGGFFYEPVHRLVDRYYPIKHQEKMNELQDSPAQKADDGN